MPLARHPGPGDILLVIEVGDSSVDSDRQKKIRLYARAGIPEAWLVNLPGDAIEVYREPGPEAYRDVRTVRRGGTLIVLRLPGLTLSADQALGPDVPG